MQRKILNVCKSSDVSEKKEFPRTVNIWVLMPVVCETTRHSRYFENFHFILSKIMPIAALEYPFWQNAGHGRSSIKQLPVITNK